MYKKNGIAFISVLIWVVILQSIDWFDSKLIKDTLVGVTLGYLVPFSGILIYAIWKKKLWMFIDDDPLFKWISYMCVSTILFLGGLAIWSDIFADTSWQYEAGLFIGGIFAGFTLIPTVKSEVSEKP